MDKQRMVREAIDKRLQGLPRERFSPMRVFGYTLYNIWLLAVFYCVFLYISASDYRSALYLHMFISMAALAITMFCIARFVKRADKWVLSKRLVYPATAIMCIFTATLVFIDPATSLGMILMGICALFTGIGSAFLFLGWVRLFADAGTRIALVEVSSSWFVAAITCLVLTFLPAPVSVALTLLSGIGSGLLLRSCSLDRPPRPMPSREHSLLSRTKKMFARGLCAAVIIGFVAGFADVISGFRFFTVDDYYGEFLLLGVGCIALVATLISALVKHTTVIYVYRLAFVTLTFGCLSILFMSNLMTYPNIIILGGYTCFIIVLIAVTIDISNYFDIPAVKAIGFSFAAMYFGETLGSGTAHLLSMLPASSSLQNIIVFSLVGALLFTNIFLFTEKELTETRLGEMVDSDCEDRKIDSVADAETESMAAVRSYLVRTYGLTPREADVLPLVIKGRTIARMQEELLISPGTVSTHVRHIYSKVGVKNRQALLDLIEESTSSGLISLVGNKGLQINTTDEEPVD